jgi:ubiquinone/menaquinone biosynthesis C-methylase UbiE
MSILSRIANKLKANGNNSGKQLKSSSVEKTPTDYWTEHNVTLHKTFASKQESLDYLAWRVDQYPFYEKLMPCSSFDNKIILDYGCGPGHDVVGFQEYSDPTKIIAMDVSSASLAEAKDRIKLHKNNEKVEVVLIDEKKQIPLDSESVDYIHSSGVLHHTPDPVKILNDFYRILKPGGFCRIMVYNYDSVWAHLYVPYYLQQVKEMHVGLPFKEAFKKSTDGENCPISNCYSPDEFISICAQAKFKTKFVGSAISMTEMSVLNHRFDAMLNLQLDKEHRNFLKELTFNEYQHPIYRNNMAGIVGVYELRK